MSKKQPKPRIIVVDATGTDSPNALAYTASASQELEGHVYIQGSYAIGSGEGVLGLVRRTASNCLAAVVIGATDPSPLSPTCIIEQSVEIRPRFPKWYQVLADLKPPRLSTPRGMVSPSRRAIPPKLRTFAITDADVLSWRQR
jgi:hypothetical protein